MRTVHTRFSFSTPGKYKGLGTRQIILHLSPTIIYAHKFRLKCNHNHSSICNVTQENEVTLNYFMAVLTCQKHRVNQKKELYTMVLRLSKERHSIIHVGNRYTPGPVIMLLARSSYLSDCEDQESWTTLSQLLRFMTGLESFSHGNRHPPNQIKYCCLRHRHALATCTTYFRHIEREFRNSTSLCTRKGICCSWTGKFDLLDEVIRLLAMGQVKSPVWDSALWSWA